MNQALSFVTVVFDAEVLMLELQARSFGRYVAARSIDRIVVLDNCVVPLGPVRRQRLLRAYGSLRRHVDFVSVRELSDAGGARGWRSQQLAKLAIARSICSDHYVALDAKNHFIRPVNAADFVGHDGRAHGKSHEYTTHPLRGSLEATLRYLGADAAAIDAAVAAFPPTATPFVFDSAVVRDMMRDVESRSERSFSQVFESEQLLEFFLYAGWLDIRGPGIASRRDQRRIPSPAVWPKAAHLDGVERAIQEAERYDAPVFAVHRQALARLDHAARQRISQFWVDRGLFDDVGAARSYIRRFCRSYPAAMAWTRLAERTRRLANPSRR